MTTNKPTALEAFELNMADADWLVSLAGLLRNDRRRRMRRELRDRVGEALRVSTKHRADMECLQNDQVFMAFLPGAAGWRELLQEVNLRPLLRQSLVAACAAVETYVADRVMENYASALQMVPPPPRLLGLTLSVHDYRRIESTYERRGWGLRQLVELQVRQQSSPTPSVIGELFSMVGHAGGLLKSVDKARGVAAGTSEKQLDELRSRRNKIAHEGDRRGRSRAPIELDEVRAHLGVARDVVLALEDLTRPGSQS